MLTFLIVLIALVCVLLMLVVLIQNPKGGGLDSTFGGGAAANQVLGAAKSGDFMEKVTWGLAAALFVLCLLTSMIVGTDGTPTAPPPQAPPAQGNQWTIGAVSCAEWTGIKLKDLLEDVGIKNDAVYIGYHAADTHLSGDLKKEPISRGVPMRKALQEETILAFKMNGEDIPLAHGYPLRLVAGGWPASASGKWINRISVRNKVHDGTKMQAPAYRVPCKPVAPGEIVKDEDMCIIESMPVKSLITYPKSGAMINKGRKLNIRGHAWAGELIVKSMEYSIDFGSTWKSCTIENPVNRLAWQHFKASIDFPKIGYYEVWARATDNNDVSQPMLVPGWNPKGYLNNACHRIAIKVV